MKTSSEINWMSRKAKVTKEYNECVERQFVGKLPYAMVMKAINNNKWDVKSEGGQGKNSYWNVFFNSSDEINFGIHFNTHTGIVEYTEYKVK